MRYWTCVPAGIPYGYVRAGAGCVFEGGDRWRGVWGCETAALALREFPGEMYARVELVSPRFVDGRWVGSSGVLLTDYVDARGVMEGVLSDGSEPWWWDSYCKDGVRDSLVTWVCSYLMQPEHGADVDRFNVLMEGLVP